jgi:hypothetical protein
MHAQEKKHKYKETRTHALVEAKKQMPQEPEERKKWPQLRHHSEQIFYIPLIY